MRLIDADALHDALRKEKKWIVHRDTFRNEGYSYDQVHFTIDKQTTIDAEPIIRCKDCRHRVYDDSFASGHICLLRRENGGRYCEDDDFCSYAERRTDERSD